MKTLIATLVLALTLAAQATRDTIEFTLFKRTEPIKVGDINVILKETDVNKQRFKIVLIIDGHSIEKKEMDIKIPIYFYSGTNTSPHELVVTKVAQDQIVGRLTGPK